MSSHIPVKSSMALPNSITVLGQPFRIEMVPDLMSGEDRVFGETNGEYHRIRIDAGLDSSRQWQVLIHEYVHAVLHIIGVGNFLDGHVEEVVAQSLEYGISDLIRNHGLQLGKALKRGENEK